MLDAPRRKILGPSVPAFDLDLDLREEESRDDYEEEKGPVHASLPAASFSGLFSAAATFSTISSRQAKSFAL